MTTLIFVASAVAAAALVVALTWSKAGIARTMLAGAIGMGVGLGVILLGQKLLEQQAPFSAYELVPALLGVYISAAAMNRRHHAAQQKALQS